MLVFALPRRFFTAVLTVLIFVCATLSADAFFTPDMLEDFTKSRQDERDRNAAQQKQETITQKQEPQKDKSRSFLKTITGATVIIIGTALFMRHGVNRAINKLREEMVALFATTNKNIHGVGAKVDAVGHKVDVVGHKVDKVGHKIDGATAELRGEMRTQGQAHLTALGDAEKRLSGQMGGVEKSLGQKLDKLAQR